MVFPYEGLSRHLNGTYCWGDSVPILNEETKAIWAYWKQKTKMSRPHKQWKLTALELIELLNDAGITANDIGQKSHQYQLGRHGDLGHYEMGNCRFITTRENLQERVMPDYQRTGHALQIEGKAFLNSYQAAKHYGISDVEVRRRVKHNNPKWKDYQYAP